MMKEAIENFARQFEFKPVIENAQKIKDFKHIIVGGMGGSHLAAGVLKTYKPGIEIYIHRNYDLPPYNDRFFNESLLIASSYSGNTEEAVSFLEEGYSRGLNMAVITTGGKLLELALEYDLPYIKLPNDGIQPRSALGYSTIALASFVLDTEMLKELWGLGQVLEPEALKDSGKNLAESLKAKIPVIYASDKNKSIVYNWKIKFNETAKIPAFYNTFPELNHNEMTSFDPTDSTKDLISKFKFIFIKDDLDDGRILNRMEVLEKQLEERGLGVTSLELVGNGRFEKIFNSLLVADWTALYLSGIYKTEPEKVPMIEDFKKRISK